MTRTKTEQLIRHKRKRSGVLVPLLEDLFQRPVEIESDEDVEWITTLLRRMVERQQARTSAPLFSPSQLAQCLRYVYLLKHHRELGISKTSSVRVEPHFYFFTGNFLHLKWQFALYKLEEYVNDPEIFTLHGVEVPIVSKHRDHGGTVDALCSVYKEPVIVDFKGLNVRAFGEITRGFVPPQYASQLSNYAMLYNAAIRNGDSPKISRGLLVSENKGGPDPKHLIALHEIEIPVQTHLPEVRRRLKELRSHGKTDSIPPPECQTTKGIQYLGCPFRKFCKEEIREIESRRRESERKDAENVAVAIPERRRRNRSGRNSKR
jgi:hypothetical protein